MPLLPWLRRREPDPTPLPAGGQRDGGVCTGVPAQPPLPVLPTIDVAGYGEPQPKPMVMDSLWTTPAQQWRSGGPAGDGVRPAAVVVVPAGRWLPAGCGWSGPPLAAPLAVHPDVVAAGLDGWLQVYGRGENGQPVSARVLPAELPPLLRVPPLLRCEVIPARRWWRPAEGDLVMQVERVYPAAAGGVAGVVAWCEVHGQRVQLDGEHAPVVVPAVELVHADALPRRWREAAGGAR